MGGREQGDFPHLPELTRSEMRLLPLLTTSLSLDEIAQALEMPYDVVRDLAKAVFAKLGPW